MRENRRFWPLLLALIACPVLQAQTLQVRLEGVRLHATAPQLHLVTDRVLTRLQNGAAVPFHIMLTAVPASGGKPLSEASSLLVLSFDLWEERFSVVQSAAPRRTASHLSASAAEAWCLENLVLAIPAVDGDSPFVVRLDIRADDAEEESPSESNPGLSLAGLIDIFSRKAKEQPLRWSAVSGPIRLRDLRKKEPGTPGPPPMENRRKAVPKEQ